MKQMILILLVLMPTLLADSLGDCQYDAPDNDSDGNPESITKDACNLNLTLDACPGSASDLQTDDEGCTCDQKSCDTGEVCDYTTAMCIEGQIVSEGESCSNPSQICDKGLECKDSILDTQKTCCAGTDCAYGGACYNPSQTITLEETTYTCDKGTWDDGSENAAYANEENIPECTDPDLNHPHEAFRKKSSVTVTYPSYEKIYTDSCIDPATQEKTAESEHILEYKCNANPQSADDVVGNYTIKCPQGESCKDGRCVSTTGCDASQCELTQVDFYHNGNLIGSNSNDPQWKEITEGTPVTIKAETEGDCCEGLTVNILPPLWDEENSVEFYPTIQDNVAIAHWDTSNKARERTYSFSAGLTNSANHQTG